MKYHRLAVNTTKKVETAINNVQRVQTDLIYQCFSIKLIQEFADLRPQDSARNLIKASPHMMQPSDCTDTQSNKLKIN